MNRIVASVSLVALGVASVQAQSTMQSAAISGPTPKWWSVAATVRGFYDDNADTAPNGGPKVNTWGYELTPTVGVSIGNQQTTFTASYVYDYIYYDRPLTAAVVNPVTGQHGGTTRDDQDHTFVAALDHAFSERYSVHVGDSFVIGQQPDTLRAFNAVNAFQRIPGNNIVNSGTITFNGVLTPILGFEVGYNNALYDYEADELSGPLNRIENYAHFDLRWNVAPETVGVFGYQFGDVVYTGTGPFANPFGTFNPAPASATNGIPSINQRDTISHTGYVGADHTFLPNLVGSVRAGASYYDYYHDNSASDFGPYAQASLTYTYAPESSFGIGFQEGRQASSLVGSQTTTNSFVHDTETSVLYGSIVHRIMPKLFGSLKGTFQNSTYHGGGKGINGESDRFYEVEADLEYRFCPNFSVHGGYDYDELDSTLSTTAVGARNYDRNRFYIGATARY